MKEVQCYSPFISAFNQELMKGRDELELGRSLSDPLEPLPNRSHGRSSPVILSETWADISADGETPPALRQLLSAGGTRSSLLPAAQTGCKTNTRLESELRQDPRPYRMSEE